MQSGGLRWHAQQAHAGWPPSSSSAQRSDTVPIRSQASVNHGTHLAVIHLPGLVRDHFRRQVGGCAHPAGWRAMLVGILAEPKVR